MSSDSTAPACDFDHHERHHRHGHQKPRDGGDGGDGGAPLFYFAGMRISLNVTGGFAKA